MICPDCGAAFAQFIFVHLIVTQWFTEWYRTDNKEKVKRFEKLGREKRIPFEVSVDPFYSQENMTRLKESVAQMEATGGTVHEVDFDD